MDTVGNRPQRRSQGDGTFTEGVGCLWYWDVFEPDVLIFHPEHVFVGEDVYVGHQTILKGYYQNELNIGSGSWIGQQVFIHSAGGIVIEENVGIGPGVKILTSTHREMGRETPSYIRL